MIPIANRQPVPDFTYKTCKLGDIHMRRADPSRIATTRTFRVQTRLTAPFRIKKEADAKGIFGGHRGTHSDLK